VRREPAQRNQENQQKGKINFRILFSRPKTGQVGHLGAEAENRRKRRENDILSLRETVQVSWRSKNMAFAMRG
jgi:hypothetical protein